ncbi:MAG: YheT family hydrolase [Candidatus Thermochlorobacter sp.]
MPLILHSTYKPPAFLANGHAQTIFAALCRTVKNVRYRRERITTCDDDFLDLDWLCIGSQHLVILSHGLESNSSRSYMLGMARALNQHGFDVLAWNFRGCSGEPNRQVRAYHSGATEDLHEVVEHALGQGRYARIMLVGFSLGANLTLKYLGEQGNAASAKIAAAVCFSVPLSLAECSRAISRQPIYNRRFLRQLVRKVIAKSRYVPQPISLERLQQLKTLWEFDDCYTAPIHGFKNAEDYYTKCSSARFLDAIAVPTLIVNAINDPFLSAACFPLEQARRLRTIWFEAPRAGGHIGFVSFNSNGLYWSEQRTIEFFSEATS